MAEKVEGDIFVFEVSYNERSKNDQVYLYFENFDTDEPMEIYLTKEDFKSVLKAMMRLDESL